MGTSGQALKDTVCRETSELDCAFGVAYAECQQLLSMGSKFAPDLPTSAAQWKDFKEKCSQSSSVSSESHKAAERQPGQHDSEPAREDVVQMVATKSSNQRLRGNRSSSAGLNADVRGIPLDCGPGCSFYFFGCGVLGNPPVCDSCIYFNDHCCVKGR